MEFGTLLLRTVLIYFVVFLIMRMMGKREIGKMSVFDVVISFMIAEIAVLVIEDTDRPMLDGIVPMVALMAIQVLIAFISMKNRRIRLLFDGKPSVIIEKGKLNQNEMRKQRYNLDDLLQQLRENQVARVSDVEFAILETSGKLSVFEKDQEESSNSNDGSKTDPSSIEKGSSMKSMPEGQDESGTRGGARVKMELPVSYRFEALPIPIIMDGKVQDQSLEKLGKNRFWLKQQLRKFNVSDYKQVFFCSVDHKGELFVDANNKK
ncbi:DUF421 domain-containing protein [Paenibacillus herberti]|uniref:YetF C-terminal domain-containing protein n=1 Tax=Paenibacillus herberti TaxID=1619309 RepID=A0A229NZX4_9BACL|nr:DUF421 domain-containing protein [Paenibacillus herberti]OXM15387.1 hypothetical protein CGZ75_01165 [Paenibacillus herberti]